MKIAIFVALLAAVALLAWRTTPPDANAPAQLDASTPAVQGGFQMVGISRGDQDGNYEYRQGSIIRKFLAAVHLAAPPIELRSSSAGVADSGAIVAGGTGLWIMPPPIPSYSSAQYSITARTSTGQCLSLDSGSANGPSLLFIIPAGYSDRVKYVDVTATDGHGHSAHWRITHLPPMRHVLTPNSPLTPTVTTDGLRLSFHAWHDDPPSNPLSHQVGIGAFMTASSPENNQSGLGSQSLQRDIRFDGSPTMSEWLPHDYKPVPSRVQTTGGLPDSAELSQNKAPFCYPLSEQSPSYAPQDSLIQVGATLRTYDTYDERVTFHSINIVKGFPPYVTGCYLSIPKQHSITTPSGVTVTLPAQDRRKATPYTSGPSLFFQISLSHANLATLPKSPLWQRYRRPVTAEIVMPPPVGAGSVAMYSGTGSVTLYSESLSLDRPHTPHGHSKSHRHRAAARGREDDTADAHPAD